MTVANRLFFQVGYTPYGLSLKPTSRVKSEINTPFNWKIKFKKLDDLNFFFKTETLWKSLLRVFHGLQQGLESFAAFAHLILKPRKLP